MTIPKIIPKDTDEYIAGFPTEIQKILIVLRAAIKAGAPDAIECISYQMPTFKLFGNLVHFAVHKNHIGFYPAPSAIKQFEENLRAYKCSKGAIQLPMDKSLPLELITKITAFRAIENKKKQEEKLKQKKTCQILKA